MLHGYKQVCVWFWCISAKLLALFPSFPAPEKKGSTGREEEEIQEVLNYCSAIKNKASSTLTIHPPRTIRGAGECPIPFPI